MATQLTPRTLDIKITKIAAKTVYYTLWANGQPEEWVQPKASTFDKSKLQVGVRYIVDTSVVVESMWDYKTRKFTKKGRYEWVTATPVVQPIKPVKLQARTAKQRLAAEAAASMPLADSGELFSW